MSDLAVSTPAPEDELLRVGPSPRRRRRRRPRLRIWMVKSHRWASFVLGLLLLVVVLSGAVLLLAPEIEQVTHPSLYDTDPGPTRVAPGEAFATVARELPDFDLAGATAYNERGGWDVVNEEGLARVDDTSGRFLGTVDRNGGVMGFIANLHECAFACEGLAGYVPFLAKPAQIARLDLTIGNEGTWGGFILTVSGVLLLLLVISGIVIWWPGRKRMRRGFNIRRGRGRYKFQYDLHKVVGIVALPALAMWAITGLNFELPKQTEGAFYAITPGSAPSDSLYEFESKLGSGPGIGMTEAIASARAAVPSDSRLASVNKPIASEKASYYEVWFSHGVDPYGYGSYPGNYGVYVDRYSGQARQYFPNPGNPTVTNDFWQSWTTGLHFGYLVGWIPRLGWLLFGLTPLLLAITGTVTWWIRRRGRRRKGSNGNGNGAAPATA